jgi:tetratricopeptide (TPR) repeat protein
MTPLVSVLLSLANAAAEAAADAGAADSDGNPSGADGTNTTNSTGTGGAQSVPAELLLVLGVAVTAIVGYITYTEYKTTTASAGLYKDIFEASDEPEPVSYEFEIDTPEKIEYERLVELNETVKQDEKLMCQALYNRAYMLIPKVQQIEADSVGLNVAKSKNLIGEDVYEMYQAAKRMLESEITDIQALAEEVQEGWGTGIMSEAVRNYVTNHKDEAFERVAAVEAKQEARHAKPGAAAEAAAKAAAEAEAAAQAAVPTPAPAPPQTTQIHAGGEGKPECYGRGEKEFKDILIQKFLPDATMQQLKLFLLFNDPNVTNIDEQCKEWTVEQHKERARELMEFPDLPVLLISPVYWMKEIDNSADPGFFKQGQQLMEAQQFQQAFQMFMSVLSQKPHNVELWLATASVLLRTGQYQQASVHVLEVLRRMRNCDPRKANLLHNLGACMGNMGRQDVAHTAFKHALALNPTHPPALEAMKSWEQSNAAAIAKAAEEEESGEEESGEEESE